MPRQALHDNEATAELFPDTVELPATSPELPVDAQAIVEWRKEAGKRFKCGIPQTVKAVDPYATADQRAIPAPEYRRTLDDMRRMSEQIKRHRDPAAPRPVTFNSRSRQNTGTRARLGLLLQRLLGAFRRLLSR
jgi:hypothetical protein